MKNADKKIFIKELQRKAEMLTLRFKEAIKEKNSFYELKQIREKLRLIKHQLSSFQA